MVVYKKILLLFTVLFLVAPLALAAQDVNLTKTLTSPENVSVGGLVSFSINLTNNGTEDVLLGNLSDSFDASVLNLSSYFLSGNSSNVSFNDSETGLLVWTFDNLSIDESVIIDINFTAISGGINSLNVADFTNSSGDLLGTSNATVSVYSLPVITIDSPMSGANTSNNTILLNFSVTDGFSGNITYNISINDVLNITNTTDDASEIINEFNFTNETDGTYVFLIESVDELGGYTNATRNITLDRGAPTVNIASPSSNQKVQPEYDLTGTASDAGTGVKNVSVYINGTFVGLATINNTSWNYTVSGAHGQTHNLTVVAYDFMEFNTSVNVTNVTLDGEAPVISGSHSPSTTSATIAVTTDEPATSLIEYGTSSSNLGQSESESSFEEDHSIQLTGLSSDTQYWYNITSCDEAGNCATIGPFSFTTDQASTGNGGGSGGGGGGELSATTLTDIANTRTLAVDRDLFFRLLATESQRRLTVESVTNDSATFSIQGLSDDVVVSLGDVEHLDVAGDGRFDMRLGLVSLGQTSATFTMRKGSGELVEPVTSEPEPELEPTDTVVANDSVVEPDAPVVNDSQEEPSQESDVQEESRDTPWGLVVVLFLVLVAMGAFLLLRKP